MDTLTDYVAFEQTIKGSRFLSELFPCQSQTQARDLLKAQKSKYVDSTHVVHAFICGKGGEIMGMSDDGEPSGTAGRPVLDVLKGRNCTNVMITVTRWFGGTLLGTGGLVKAYSGGTKQVIQKADSLKLFSKLVQKKEFTFSTNYNIYKLIKNIISQYNITELSEGFGTDITISGKIEENQFDLFKENLTNLSNGKIIL